MELLPKDVREVLPELYANEEIGLAAQALVKFFTPDSIGLSMRVSLTAMMFFLAS